MWLSRYSDVFPASCFLCSRYLNKFDDTSNWEKFDIQRFSIFHQQEKSKLISSTFLAISCELLSSFWSLVFFSAGCHHSPCEWTSQERQNKFVRLSHVFFIACGSSDVQAILKPGIFFASALREEPLTIATEKRWSSMWFWWILTTKKYSLSVVDFESVVTRSTDVSFGSFSLCGVCDSFHSE